MLCVMELLTSTEVAEQLGLTKWHVSRMARTGKLASAMQLPGARGAYLFDPETVRAFAAERAGAKS